jgi:plastocyanin
VAAVLIIGGLGVLSALGACGSSSNARSSASPVVASTAAATTATTLAPTTTIAAPTTVGAPTTTVAPPTTLAHSSQAGPSPAGAAEQVMEQSKYSAIAIEAKAGRFVVHLVNRDDSVRHDMIVGDALGHRFASSDRVEPGHDLVFTIDDLPPGTYKFWCSVGVHAASGMKGILTVSA